MASTQQSAEKSRQQKTEEKPQTPARVEESGDQIPDNRITIKELKEKMDKNESVIIIDARSGRSYIGSSVKIKGAIHITIDQLESRIGELPKDKEIITYCT